MRIQASPLSSPVPSAGDFRSGSERAQALRQQKVITLHGRRTIIHLLHQWVRALLCWLLSSIRTLARDVLEAAGRFMSSLGWAGARNGIRLLAGIVGAAATGRVSRARRPALAHPTFSQPAKTGPFSRENLLAAVRRRLRRRPGKRWTGDIDKITSKLAEDGGWEKFQFEVVFLRKGERAKHTYRAAVRFEPNDALVQSVAARELLRCFDPYLLDCCWARRLRCDGIHRPTHNDAVTRLRAFRMRHRGRVLWLAKLDVKSLHDTIAHAEVRSSLAEAVARAGLRGVAVDEHALRMVDALLATYSFGADVKIGASNLLAARDLKGNVAWPLEDLKQFYPDPVATRMGLPQGSALSDLLANLVLDAVDRAVVGDGADPNLFYARYLDDSAPRRRGKGAVMAT